MSLEKEIFKLYRTEKNTAQNIAYFRRYLQEYVWFINSPLGILFFFRRYFACHYRIMLVSLSTIDLLRS